MEEEEDEKERKKEEEEKKVGPTACPLAAPATHVRRRRRGGPFAGEPYARPPLRRPATPGASLGQRCSSG